VVVVEPKSSIARSNRHDRNALQMLERETFGTIAMEAIEPFTVLFKPIV
jgi:hypothetical protein